MAVLTIAVVANPAGARDVPPAPTPDTAQQPPAQAKDYPAVPLLSTGTSIVGETIRYPKGPAHVTAAIVTLAPGGKTIMHKHGVPLFAYILEGELTVNYGKHGTRTYRAGQTLMEAMNVPHFGINNGAQPVRLLAVYMGSKRAKDVIPVK
ncbi:MAG: cupin domain-containing protein [Rhizobiales bacterium]|jgi:quercetin dioxygenase-like cupin family protein|nr:cupin domain-containing protein [Hyphomicrobiales bacterium]